MSYNVQLFDQTHINTNTTFTGNIFVCGTIFIDAEATFTNASVFCTEGAEIVVTSTGKIKTTALTDFHSCISTAKWKGIRVEGGVVDFFANNTSIGTSIRQAIIGLNFRPSTSDYKTSKVRSTNLKDNETGIYLGNPGLGESSPGMKFSPLRFDGNVFDRTLTTNPTATTSTTFGMQIVNSTPCVLSSSGVVNSFSSLQIGIYAVKSNLSLGKSVFIKNRIAATTPANLESGWGLYCEKSSISVVRCTFTENQTGGIYTQNMNGLINVNNCVFSTGKEPLSVAGTFRTMGKFGILSEKNYGSGRYVITNNFFNLNGRKEVAAISVFRFPVTVNNLVKNIIKNNTIEVTDVGHAYNLEDDFDGRREYPNLIEVLSKAFPKDIFEITFCTLNIRENEDPINGIYIGANGDNMQITYNQVNYLFPNVPPNGGDIGSLGISCVSSSGSGNYIKFNKVLGTAAIKTSQEISSSWIKCGIHVQDSPNWVVCTNTVDNSRRGAHFDGHSNFCDFANNDLNNHFHGVEYVSGGNSITDVGDQNYHQNKWNVQSLATGLTHAKYTDILSGSPPPASLFLIRQKDDQTNKILKAEPTIGWVQNDMMANCLIFHSSCVLCPDQNLTPPGLSETDKKIIQGTYIFLNTVNEWDMKRRLLLKLIEHPEFRPVGSPAETFYNQQSGQNIWPFANAEDKYNHSAEMPVSLLNRFSNWSDNLLLHNNTVVNMDSLMNSDPNNANYSTWEAQKTANATAARIDWDSLQAIAAEISIALNNKLALQVLPYLNGLPSSTAHESNWKQVYQYHVSELSGNILTQTDYSIIKGICEQCPQTGGDIVRYANSLLPKSIGRKYQIEGYYDPCKMVQPRNNKNNEVYNNFITIFPNPATDAIQLKFEKSVTGEWEIYDPQGKFISKGILDNQSQTDLQLNNQLPNGIYNILIHSKEFGVFSRRFIVIHE
jgi:hypothetical protein